MKNNSKSSHYAVVPAHIRSNKTLSFNEKILLAEIASLCNNERKYCWSGNKYFTELFNRSESAVIRWIHSLEKQGFISIEYEYFFGTKRIKARRIFLNKKNPLADFPELAGAADYYSIIPSEIRADKNLPAGAKILYGEIAASCANKKEYCGKSNSYFAELYGVDASAISKWVKSLSENGYLSVALKYREGRKAVEERRIRLKKKLIPLKRNRAAGIAETQASPLGLPRPEYRGIAEQPAPLAKPQKGIAEMQEVLVPASTTATTTAADKKIFEKKKEENKKGETQNTKSGEKIKTELKSLDRRLVLGADFYGKAGNYLETNGVAPDFLTWLYGYCLKKKNVTSFAGLFYKLFFDPSLLELFRETHRPPSPRSAEPETAVCPVCGTEHKRKDLYCPVCGLVENADSAEIRYHKRYISLSAQEKTRYETAKSAIGKLPFSEYAKKTALYAELDAQFHLTD